MHGLQTEQRVEINSVSISRDPFETDGLLTANGTYNVDNAIALGAIINSTDWNADLGQHEIYIKRLYDTHYFTNLSTYNMYFQCIWFRCKKDQVAGTNLESILNNDAPSTLIPYYSVTTGHDTRKVYKILKQKTYVLRPNQTKVIRVTSQYSGRTTPITQAVEGDASYYQRKGCKILYTRSWGCPISYIPSASSSNNPLPTHAPLHLGRVTKTFCSWYAMDISYDATRASTNLPTTWSSQNVAFVPTLYNSIRGVVGHGLITEDPNNPTAVYVIPP